MVGLKQSNGVIPHSQVADAFGNYTYVTPMTRTVMDTALMLQAMAGPHPFDPWSIGTVPQDYLTAARAEGDLSGKRVLYSLAFGGTVVSKDVRAAFERALGKLRELGAELIELTETLPDMEPVWKVINHTTWRARFDDMIKRDGNRVSASLVRQVAMAADWSGVDYQRAMFQRADLFRMVQGWFERADYLVTPTLSRTALPIEQDLFEPIAIDGVEVGELRRNWFPYTMPFNITGHPALTLCCGYGADETADRPADRRPLPRRGLGAARRRPLRGLGGLAGAPARRCERPSAAAVGARRSRRACSIATGWCW